MRWSAPKWGPNTPRSTTCSSELAEWPLSSRSRASSCAMITFGPTKRRLGVIRERTGRPVWLPQPDAPRLCGSVADHTYTARWRHDRNRDPSEGQTGDRPRRGTELGHHIRTQHRRIAERRSFTSAREARYVCPWIHTTPPCSRRSRPGFSSWRVSARAARCAADAKRPIRPTTSCASVIFRTPVFSFIKFPLDFSNAPRQARDLRSIGHRAKARHNRRGASCEENDDAT
jgi:hypothetical protein